MPRSSPVGDRGALAALSAVVLLAAACLAGCGSSETATTQTTPRVATVTQPAITPAPSATPTTTTPTSTAPATPPTNTGTTPDAHAQAPHQPTTGTPAPKTSVPDKSVLKHLHLQGPHAGAALGLLGICSPAHNHTRKLAPSTRARLNRICSEIKESEKATKGRKHSLGL